MAESKANKDEPNPETCPGCGGHDIDGESIDIEGIYVTQVVSCIDCDAEWSDTYKFTGREIIYKGNRGTR